jgi:hypothetical protein
MYKAEPFLSRKGISWSLRARRKTPLNGELRLLVGWSLCSSILTWYAAMEPVTAPNI